MRCEDCLPLVEAFFDGTLDEPEAGTVGAHVAACPVCSDALEAAQQEQETYAAFWREAGVNPPTWASVLSAIEEGRADSHAPERGGKWAAFLSPRRLVPAFATVAACVLLAVGLLSFGLLARRDSTPPRQEMATRSGDGAVASSGAVPAASETGAENLTAGHAVPRVDSTTTTTRALIVKRGVTAGGRRIEARGGKIFEAERGKIPDAAGLTASPTGGGPEAASTGTARFEHTLMLSREAAAAPSLSSLGRGPNMDGETARHIERVQLLFLSLKHTADAGQTIDVSYERGLSRRLLNRNVLLRREAESKGNLPLEELLDSVEPVFAEIANLPAQASPAEVAQIKERIRKKGVVALLKAHSAALESEAERGRF